MSYLPCIMKYTKLTVKHSLSRVSCGKRSNTAGRDLLIICDNTGNGLGTRKICKNYPNGSETQKYTSYDN